MGSILHSDQIDINLLLYNMGHYTMCILSVYTDNVVGVVVYSMSKDRCYFLPKVFSCTAAAFHLLRVEFEGEYQCSIENNMHTIFSELKCCLFFHCACLIIAETHFCFL